MQRNANLFAYIRRRYKALIKLLLKMPQPDPIWSYFIQLEHVPGFKQKRRECKECKHQINDSLRSARTHLLKLQLHKKEVILATHTKEVMIIHLQAQIFQLQCQRKLITFLKQNKSHLN